MTRSAPVRAGVLALSAFALAFAPARAAADTPAPTAPAAPAPAAPKPAAPKPASEPPPDSSAVEAGDANLESIAPRKGVIFTFGIGGSLSVGFGIDNATGRGGAAALRLAHVASPRSTVTVEILFGALFFNISDADMKNHLYRTDAANFLVGTQYYVNRGLWLHAALGYGRYAGDALVLNDLVVRERFRLGGPSGSAGAGIDVIRLRRFRASVEFASTAMLNRDGILSSNSFLFGLTID